MGLSISAESYSSLWICVRRIHRSTFFFFFFDQEECQCACTANE